jgi:hypothetical protein
MPKIIDSFFLDAFEEKAQKIYISCCIIASKTKPEKGKAADAVN